MSRRRPRIPGTYGVQVLGELEGEAKELGLIWVQRGRARTPIGDLEALGTDDDRVAHFFDAHGSEPGRDVDAVWGLLTAPMIATLELEAVDFEAPRLELAFALPESFAYIEAVAAVGEVILVSLRGDRMRVLSFPVPRDIAHVAAACAALRRRSAP